jgi:hypothetical protein
MTRLLTRARQMPNDPDLFDGLVIACRYCGLLRASVAAAERVRQLDPSAKTSVQYTYLFLGDDENATRFDLEDSPYVKATVELQRGHLEEAMAYIAVIPRSTPIHALFVGGMEAVARGQYDAAVENAKGLRRSGFSDPEGLSLAALIMARAGAHDDALDTIEAVIGMGFTCPQMRAMPWFSSLAGHERFERLMATAEEGRRHAAAAFRAAGGEALLGVEAAS